MDVSEVKGSGPLGRIVKKDILGIEESSEKVPLEPDINKSEQSNSPLISGSSTPNGLLESKSVPLSGMRSVIAKRLSESKTTIPHFYLQKEINIKPLLDTRLALNENSEKQSKLTNTDFNKLSVNDLILKSLCGVY